MVRNNAIPDETEVELDDDSSYMYVYLYFSFKTLKLNNGIKCLSYLHPFCINGNLPEKTKQKKNEITM